VRRLTLSRCTAPHRENSSPRPGGMSVEASFHAF